MSTLALQDPLSKVYEVTFQVSYQKYAHFSRIFRKYTGYSPTEYRKITGNN
ncbi:helix-turn-helix domain-containing protein [Paenibacillus eucommiae]|uniref:YesN/AraC family two-component response regulator n=1 Tax=Paenibacillus eucommiae TaxID=1355755 RepID=A0ABS4J059_9BACL|nr:helix-turn-helix domain-containing protein [Paenibacillus eucommiae]MBP1993193.1 YesN/AraC family two-component response regulator [Paenibacillus eucommiae]